VYKNKTDVDSIGIGIDHDPSASATSQKLKEIMGRIVMVYDQETTSKAAEYIYLVQERSLAHTLAKSIL
jgi:hypothetical protein